MRSRASLSIIRFKRLTFIRKEFLMAAYYIGADVHSNNKELAIEKRGRIVERCSVPTTIPEISTVLNLLQGNNIFAVEERPMASSIHVSFDTAFRAYTIQQREKLLYTTVA